MLLPSTSLLCSLFMVVMTMISSTAAFMPNQASTTNRLAALESWKDMMANLDDIIDDFMAKRMGNGEVFYGKRKFKPSNRPNTEGEYNGMGLSDKTKIDVVRDYKEELVERRRQQQQQD